MADKKQGLFGGLLRQPSDAEGGDAARDDSAVAAPRPGERVEAYEEDWYRSLKALAAQRQPFAGADEPAPDPEPGTETTAEDATTEAGARALEHADATPPAAQEPAVLPDIDGGPLAETRIVELPADGPAMVAPAAEAPPSTAPAVAEMPPAAETPRSPLLDAPDPEERRRALSVLSGRELSEGEVARIGALVLDPDPAVRSLALEILSRNAASLDEDTVRRALQDPADEVRAVAVRLASARGPQELAHLVPLIAARRWQRTQRTVLDALPELAVAASPLGEQDLSSILTAVGELDGPPRDWERVPFARLAAAIGVARLAEAMSLPDDRRVGAARLLVGDESPTVLRALASHLADPLEEMREAGAAAARTLAQREQTQPRGPEAVPATQDHAERVASLVQAMRDPDEAVRHLARAGLASLDRGAVLAWAKETIRAGDAEAASVAIEAARHLGVTEVAGAVLERAASLDAEHHPLFVEALRSIGLEPGRLVALVSDVDESHRAEAIRIAFEVAGASSLPHLQAYLDDPAAVSRMAVLDVMGEAGYAGVAEVARRTLETDLSAAVRAAAVRMIGRAGGEAWSATIPRALQDPDPTVRMTAVEWLPGGGEGETTRILLHALSDGDERVRKAAVSRLASRSDDDRSLVWQALRSSGSKERGELTAAVERVNPGLLTELAFESLRSLDQEERVLSIEVVGWGTTQACVEAAIHALQDPSAEVRRTATAALARLRDPSAAGALGKALGDPDPEVRVGVVRTLGVIDDESVLGFLVSALSDPDAHVRQVTSEVLTEWSSPAVAKRLAGVLAVPSLRDSATELLIKMGPSAVELLIDVLRQGHLEVTDTVGSLLQRIVGLDEFLSQMGSVDPDRRLRALEAAGSIGGPAAVEALVARLSDPDERVRVRAARLLGRLRDPRAREALAAAAAADPVPEAATAAGEALAALVGETTAA